VQQGNESKLRLIRCFMEKDTHLSDIVFGSLRPYNIIVDPAPVLSLSLDIKAMVHWYTEALEAEIKIYMHNVFLVRAIECFVRLNFTCTVTALRLIFEFEPLKTMSTSFPGKSFKTALSGFL
jgi:hypothetical protein